MLRHRGDRITIALSLGGERKGSAWVRTNLGRSRVRQREIISHVEEHTPLLARDWHDVPMRHEGDGEYRLTLPLLEVGHFEAKAFFLPEGSGDPAWPGGDNVYLKVEAAVSRCANSVYSAFVRQFGPNRRGTQATREDLKAIGELEAAGYTVIPRSGTFRDLEEELDFIIGQLGFRIIQLLPIHPTPTVYARMGEFGSPFAALDFMEVDPALAEFDRKTTPLDQFRELADAIHHRHARVFLDIPVNHTGWASYLHIRHPEWFPRNPDDTFRSPGAWGITWADLLQLDYEKRAVWHHLAEVFLFWCREGVDGFRCDAGYMIPLPVWEYVTAKVRQSYPDTVFLLEGLGGKMCVTESLLRFGGLDWAYSEIFQNYDRGALEHYLPGAIDWSETAGTMIHFAETHDNNRLAATARPYSRMRTALAALASYSGAFGITNGVEWYAEEKVDVHQACSLDWGADENQVAEIARLNALLSTHPAFGGDVRVRMVQCGEGNVLVLRRTPLEGEGELLVLVNLDSNAPETAHWRQEGASGSREEHTDLLTGDAVAIAVDDGIASCRLDPAQVRCLSAEAGDLVVVNRGQRSFGGAVPGVTEQALEALALAVHQARRGVVDIADLDPEAEAAALAEAPEAFCARIFELPVPAVVTRWSWPRDARREVMVPPGHFLLIEAEARFRVCLHDGEEVLADLRSVPRSDGTQFTLILPREEPEVESPLILDLTVHEPAGTEHVQASLSYLSSGEGEIVQRTVELHGEEPLDQIALCTNGRGAMAQVRAAWGELRSQYDSLLAGNLDPHIPVDRHVMLTRLRAWMVYRGYSHEIGPDCLTRFAVDDEGVVSWFFQVPAGGGSTVPLVISLRMIEGRNAVRVGFQREAASTKAGAPGCSGEVTLILRPDIEDRNCHAKTKAYTGPESRWPGAIRAGEEGFEFHPGGSRRLVLRMPSATFVSQPEWNYNVSHPEEASRCLGDSSDLFSPGYLETKLAEGQRADLAAEILVGDEVLPEEPGPDALRPTGDLSGAEASSLDRAMKWAISHFIVRRDDFRTVIAGYPWFLDWGRDTLICLRGIIAAGWHDQAREIIEQFARFEDRGTLPNTIHGADTSNRDTSDAPLWLFTACNDLRIALGDDGFFDDDCGGRTLREVLCSIADHHRRGVPNGVTMDSQSGLIFSPTHFTWMDTNYPAGTPREGYPVEIQALWLAALSLLGSITKEDQWGELAGHAGDSLHRFFTDPARDHLSDCLHCAPGTKAADAVADDALRPNQLFAITLGALTDKERSERILSACQELLVPGAIRSLADRKIQPPLPVWRDGELLNDPDRPYCGHYLGDEDTRRKPAYHNGTAWTWPFPSYCEALFLTFGDACRKTARAFLASSAKLANRGSIGHVPEVVDGDFPHTARGCSAQAWGATEIYRVWKSLE